MTASVDVDRVSVHFPIYGADARSLKKHLARIAIGGQLGVRDHSSTPIVAALSEVSLSLRPGDRLALVGHNGSGKTTLLRALAGVYEPDQGRVQVSGRIASLLDLSLGLDPSATGFENIRLRGLVAGLTAAEIRAKMDAIAEFSGLGAFLNLPMKTYSSGMSARLAFAVATSVDAEVLLMDEWIAVGDAQFRDQAHDRLSSMIERSHIMVLASHDFGLVRSLCNCFIHLNHGRASAIMPIEAMDQVMAEHAASLIPA